MAPPKPNAPTKPATEGTENGPSASGWPRCRTSPRNSETASSATPIPPMRRKVTVTAFIQLFSELVARHLHRMTGLLGQNGLRG